MQISRLRTLDSFRLRITAEDDQLLGMGGLATHPQETVLEATAREVGREFLLHYVQWEFEDR
jgi:hypothetical protein